MLIEIADSQALAFYEILKKELSRLLEDDRKHNFQFTSILNGRERWLALVYTYGYSPKRQLVIKFGEHRNSDSFRVESIEMEENHWRMPTQDSFTEQSYRESKSYPAFTFQEALNDIRNQIEIFSARRRLDVAKGDRA